MSPKAIPAIPVFVLFEGLLGRIEALWKILHDLHGYLNASRLLGVDVYYTPVTDSALMEVRLDARVTTMPELQRVRASVASVGGEVLGLARLDAADRRRLDPTRYGIRILELPSPGDALHVLAQRLGRPAPLFARPMRLAGTSRVRFRRGQRWESSRARSLTSEGVYLATGTPPRRGSLVDIEITVAATTCQMRGLVLHVTPKDVAAAIGARGFGVRFSRMSPDDRVALDALVAVAKDGDLCSPALLPRRREMRYPLQWPVSLSSGRTSVALSALDVSQRGIFLADAHAPEYAPVRVTIPLEDPARVVEATARIARSVPDAVARARGSRPGLGLEVVSFAPGSERRYSQFVERVAQRSERVVLVAAAPERILELATTLSSSGYEVYVASDWPSVLAQIGERARTPDLVVLDKSMRQHLEVAGPEGVLRQNAMRTLTLDGETGSDARSRVDDVLLLN